MYCMNCGQKISDDAKVCEFCGAPVEIGNTSDESAGPVNEEVTERIETPESVEAIETVENPQVIEGTEPKESGAGAAPEQNPYAGGQPVNQSAVPAVQVKVEEVKEKSKKKLTLVLGIVAGVLVLAVAGAVGYKLLGGIGTGSSDKKAEYPGVYYLQDNELYFSKYSKAEPKKVDNDIIYRWSDETDYSSYSSQFTISKDGRYIFYAQDCDPSTDTFDLYYISTSLKKDSIKVADSVASYRLLDNNKVVFRDDNDSLYISDLKDKNRIAKNVSEFYIDDSQKNILWVDVDRNLYYQGLDLKKDKEKLDKDIDTVNVFTDRFQKIVYSKYDDNRYDIYEIKDLKDKEKILGNVDTYSAYLTDGKVNIYFSKDRDASALGFASVIEDDYPEDANMKQPDIKDFTTYTTVNGFWGPTTREEVDPKYYDEVEKYNKKLERDNLRNRITSTDIGLTIPTNIHFYEEGKDEEKVLTGPMEVVNLYQADEDTPVILLRYFDYENMEKVKLSDIYENSGAANNLEDMVREKVYDAMVVKVIKGTNVADVDLDGMYPQYAVMYDSDKKQLGVIAYDNKDINKAASEREGELYSISLANSNLGEIKKIDSEVDTILGSRGGKLFYLTEVDSKNGEGILRCNGEKIADDVSGRYFYQNEDTDCFLFFKDYDSSDYEGTLYVYTGGKAVKVADDVHSCYAYNDKYIATLSDYSMKSHMGDLKVFNGKDNIKIASDVNAIVY